MDIADVQKRSGFSAFMRKVTGMAMYGIQHGFQDLDIKYEEMESLYKGLRYKLYYRPVPADIQTRWFTCRDSINEGRALLKSR